MTVQTASSGHTYQVKSIQTSPKVKDYLSSLGLLPGLPITILSQGKHRVVFAVQEGRYAIDTQIAQQIEVGTLS